MKPDSNNQLDKQSWRRYLGVLAIVCGLMLVIGLVSEAWARSSGGRYGGRSGFSQSRSGSSGGGWSGSRSTPTTPYGGSSSPGYYPPVASPGFGFFPALFFLPFLGWGGGGGFGFGGIFTLLIIFGIVALVGRVLLRNLASAWRDRRDLAPAVASGRGRYAVVKCQIALLSTARSLQQELRTAAGSANTDSVTGLAAALQDAVMAVMRHRDYWRYGVVQVDQASTLDDAERAFNHVVNQERAKLSEELTVNLDGVRRRATTAPASSQEVGAYLVVTLMVATGYPEFAAFQTPTAKDIEATLQRLSTLLSSDLLAIEVMWSPENPQDSLTEEELIAEYPELSGL